MKSETCKRCLGSTNNITTMSVFNTDVICRSCKSEEKKHPKYQEAVDAEFEEIKKGNYNFPGIGYESFETGGLINGDCYLTTGRIALGLFPKDIKFKGTPYVVHSEVSGQGDILNLRFGHAWIEDDEMVYEYSNGRNISLPKELYYSLGKVWKKAPKYYRYTFEEARKKMLETEHYGSWDLETESGL
jgi:hypothetical protein